MKTSDRTSVGLPTALATGPTDLWAVVVVTLLADGVVLAGGPRLLRMAAAVLLLFALPGYAIVAALYPGRERPVPGSEDRQGITLGERVALSFGVSLALVPLVALVTWPLTRFVAANFPTAARPLRASVVPVLTVVVVVGAVLAARRRSRLPSGHQFTVPVDRWVDGARAALGPSASRGNRVLSVALGLSILLAAASLGYGLAAPADGEQYTTAAVLAPNEDGPPATTGYPSTLEAGEPVDLVLKLGNHEGEAVDYTVVIRAERLALSDGEQTVTEASPVDRLSVSVAAGETRLVRHSVATDLTGRSVRLTYYVYRGDAPTTPSEASAHRMVYLRVSVGGG